MTKQKRRQSIIEVERASFEPKSIMSLLYSSELWAWAWAWAYQSDLGFFESSLT